MELTKEYFDEKLNDLATKKDLEGAVKDFATKKDLEDAVNGLASKEDLRPLATKDDFDELARMTAEGFAEAAKQRSLEALRIELTDIRKTIDKMFDQMDKNIELRVRHGEELLELRTRVEKVENNYKKYIIQNA